MSMQCFSYILFFSIFFVFHFLQFIYIYFRLYHISGALIIPNSSKNPRYSHATITNTFIAFVATQHYEYFSSADNPKRLSLMHF
mmetsp:Transcript_126040/g.247091  ORF Transcript_126040/g.247091 Transcript_126040/m.247091 type:complete len:84 (-) Transcript_126040:1106-1357(-)